MKEKYPHLPVMVREVVEGLGTNLKGWVVDCTLGMGGHSLALLKSSPEINILGVDKDRKALEIARERLSDFGDRFRYVHSEFKDIDEWQQSLPEAPAGILVDLGLSTFQLQSGRGFSFKDSSSLDMRMDPETGEPVSEVLARIGEKDLIGILRKYGEEPHARRIASAIITKQSEGSVGDASKLASIIEEVVPRRPGMRIHPATRTFQALRIYVNRELEGLADFVRKAVELLTPGGRIAVLAYHSLEDRIVKQTFRELCRGCTCPPEIPACVCGKKPSLRLVFRKAMKPSSKEIQENPASRSARFRLGEKI